MNPMRRPRTKFKIRLLVKKTLSVFCLSILALNYMNCSAGGFQSQVVSNQSSSSSSSGDGVNPGSTPVAAGQKDVYMAFGKLGRTLMSCDDGVTWINDRSDNESGQCWVGTAATNPNYVECDHNSGSSTGLDAGTDGWFYAQFGWGANGTVRRTRDGVNWEVVRSGGSGGGLAVVNNIVTSLLGKWAVSVDKGITWVPTGGSVASALDHPFITHLNDKLVVTGRGNNQIAISYDSGLNWVSGITFEVGWNYSFAQGNGVLVYTATRMSPTNSPIASFAARSLDNGLTWTSIDLFASQLWQGSLVFDGNQFINWGDGKRWTSADGVNWTTSQYYLDGKPPATWWTGSMAYNSRTGTLVSIVTAWGQKYETQKAFRSKDGGLNFTSLDSNHFKGGHPIKSVILGSMDSSSCLGK